MASDSADSTGTSDSSAAAHRNKQKKRHSGAFTGASSSINTNAKTRPEMAPSVRSSGKNAATKKTLRDHQRKLNRTQSLTKVDAASIVDAIVRKERKARLAVVAAAERKLAWRHNQGRIQHGSAHHLSPVHTPVLRTPIEEAVRKSPSAKTDVSIAAAAAAALQLQRQQQEQRETSFGLDLDVSGRFSLGSSDDYKNDTTFFAAQSASPSIAASAAVTGGFPRRTPHVRGVTLARDLSGSAAQALVDALCELPPGKAPQVSQLDRLFALIDVPGLPDLDKVFTDVVYKSQPVADTRAFKFLLSARLRDTVRALGGFLRRVSRGECAFLQDVFGSDRERVIVDLLNDGTKRLCRFLVPGYLRSVLVAGLPQIKRRPELKLLGSFFVEALFAELLDLCRALLEDPEVAQSVSLSQLRDQLRDRLMTFQEMCLGASPSEFAAEEYHARKTIVLGVIHGLGQAPLPFSTLSDIQAFADRMHVWLEAATGPKTKVLVTHALTHLAVYAPKTYPASGADIGQGTLFAQLLKEAQMLCRSRSGQSIGIVDAAVNLAIACSITYHPITDTVCTWLRKLVVRFVELKSDQDLAIGGTNSVLHGLVVITRKFPATSAQVCQGLVDLLLKKASSAVRSELPNYEVSRDSIVAALCNILRHQMLEENGDTRLVSRLFVTLHTPLYHAHTKYVKRLGQSSSSTSYASMRSNRMSLVDTSGSSLDSWGPAAAKGSLQLQQAQVDKYQQTEAMICDIFIILGRMTVCLNDPHVTSLILPRLVSRVHYPPRRVDLVLIEQLTSLCVLGQEAAYDEIIVEFMNVFKRELTDLQRSRASTTQRQGVIFGLDSQATSLAIPNALQTLAREIPRRYKSMRQNLLHRMITLFQQLGRETTTPEMRAASSPLIQGMGYLLPILADLMETSDDWDDVKNPRSQDSRLSRSLWFYLVAFRFVDKTAWRSDWFECVKHIAHHHPAVTFQRIETYEQVLLEIGDFLRTGNYKDRDISGWVAFLTKSLNVPAAIKRLKPAEVFYVMSVFHLEKLRASSGSFLGMFAYLEDAALAHDQQVNVMACIQEIAAQVFPVFHEFVRANTHVGIARSGPGVKAKLPRDQLLERETVELILKFCSSSQSARVVADRFIIQMVKFFPQILWNDMCVGTLLEVVDSLSVSAHQPLVGAVTISVEQLDGQRHGTTIHRLQLQDNVEKREALLSDVVRLAKQYFRQALDTAPSTSRAVLQQYLLRYHDRRDGSKFGGKQHVGEALVLQILSDHQRPAHILVGRDSNIPSCVESIASIFSREMTTKAAFVGEVRGFLDANLLVADITRTDRAAVVLLEQRIHESLSSLELRENEFANAFFRACALVYLLCLEPSLAQKPDGSLNIGSSASSLLLRLLRTIVWRPVQRFGAQEMRTAVFGWTWLLSHKALRVPLMIEMRSAWQWTMHENLGLFSNATRRRSPLEQDRSTNEAERVALEAKLEDELLAHELWLEFLRERLTTALDTSTAELEVLVGVLMTAVMEPAALCVIPSSIGVRFSLLSLCIDLLQQCARENIKLSSQAAFVYLHSPLTERRSHGRDAPRTTFHEQLTETLLRERVYKAALQWFTLDPTFLRDPSDTGSTDERSADVHIGRVARLNQQIHVLRGFCYAIDDEDSILKKESDRIREQQSYFEMLESDHVSNYRTHDDSSKRRRWDTLSVFNRHSHLPKNETQPRPTSLGDRLHFPKVVAYQQRKDNSLRRLLQVLIGNEIDRILAWADPLTEVLDDNPFSVSVDARVVGVTPFAKKVNASWANLCEAAWNVSPRLCVKMHERFPFGVAQKRIRRFLTARIERNPLLVADVPAALRFVVVQTVVETASKAVSCAARYAGVRGITTTYDIVHTDADWFYEVAGMRGSFTFAPPLARTAPAHAIALEHLRATGVAATWPRDPNVHRDAARLRALLYWAPSDPVFALQLLRREYRVSPLVTRFSVRVLHTFDANTIMFYLAQLVQALRYDQDSIEDAGPQASTQSKFVPRAGVGIVHDYLVAAARNNDLLAQQLIWNAQTYLAEEGEFKADSMISAPAARLKHEIESNFHGTSKQATDEEFGFLQRITDISAVLMQHKKPQRKARLRSELAKIATSEIPPSAYVPSSPDVKIHDIEPGRSTSLQSAAKAPILVAFWCHDRRDERALDTAGADCALVSKSAEEDEGGPYAPVVTRVVNDVELQCKGSIAWSRAFRHAVIFKTDDDLRQDMIALQVVALFDKIFKSVNLDLFLYPYQVIATGPGEGIIEVVQNSTSRNDLGKATEGGLVEWFHVKFGLRKSPEFQQARLNFIKSLAGYAVLCYVLQVKDRHNGNIMFDDKGHIVHIDFGFIFESSPGGNFGFEMSPFKLSEEMIQLMGERGSPAFQQFVVLTVKAFLACRRYASAIITLVQLMLDTGLPCFRGRTIELLQDRLSMRSGPNGDEFLSERAAAIKMSMEVERAHGVMGMTTAKLYDLFQKMSQDIEY